MRTVSAIVTLFLVSSLSVHAGWPTIGRHSIKSSKKKAYERVVSAGFEVTANPEDGSVRAGIDLLGLVDKETKFFGSDALPFFADLGEYAAIGFVGYKVYELVTDDDDGGGNSTATAVTEKGTVNVGDGATVNGGIETLGANVNIGKGATVNGSINTGPAAPEKE